MDDRGCRAELSPRKKISVSSSPLAASLSVSDSDRRHKFCLSVSSSFGSSSFESIQVACNFPTTLPSASCSWNLTNPGPLDSGSQWKWRFTCSTLHVIRSSSRTDGCQATSAGEWNMRTALSSPASRSQTHTVPGCSSSLVANRVPEESNEATEQPTFSSVADLTSSEAAGGATSCDARTKQESNEELPAEFWRCSCQT